jgi:hypothetical protein
MPEVNKDATFLIAISYQALARAEKGDYNTTISNCTVVIVFAGFYIEANLNQIIEKINGTDELNSLFRNPGLQNKLAWFYNRFVAHSRSTGLKQLRKEIEEIIKNHILDDAFPGFTRIYKFRNDIAHGHIDSDVANLDNAKVLRIEAKTIVDKLFEIAFLNGYSIPRPITYADAIDNPNQEQIYNIANAMPNLSENVSS